MSALRRPDGGQILVIFAGGLAALIVIVGLVVDGGSVFFSRRDSQNGSDLASLAGVKRLADYYVKNKAYVPGTSGIADNPWLTIRQSLRANGCDDTAGCAWTANYVGARSGSGFPVLAPVQPTDTAPPGAVSGPKALGIRVDMQINPHTYFLGLIGQTSWDVRTTATSMTGKPTTIPGGQMLPIAMVYGQQLTPGSLYSLTNGANGPGNFGWLSWTGSNDPGTLADSICIPDNPGFVLPHQYPGDPGKSNSADVRTCLQYWVDSGQPVLIPIVYAKDDPTAPPACTTGGNGNIFTFCIKGVVAFVLTSYDQPAVDQIVGRFVNTMPYSSGDQVPGGVTAPPASGDAFYLIGLAS